MFKNKKTKILMLFLIFVFFITSGLGCRCSIKDVDSLEPVNLVYWRTQDSKDDFTEIINGFKSLYPHVSITIKTIREEEYEQALLEAWAEDRGPDIFSIPSAWLGKYQTKILPVDFAQEIALYKKIVTGQIKKEERIIKEIKKAPTLRELRERFVETVPQDIVIDNQIYGLPLSLDVLSLYYNRDILNSSGIANSPQTWQEFVTDVNLITLQDRYGEFIQSGAALGTANNVEYLTDIISLLMLQNGTPIINEKDQAIFNEPLANDSSYYPGQEAVKFYTSFANPYQEGIYTWNKEMPNSLDAFVQGKVGFVFGYAKDLSTIRLRAPKLNFDVAPVPQISKSLKEVNYAQYWLETVSKKTAHPREAWGFILYATESKNAKTFIERTKKPTAHRSLIEKQLEDFDLAPFAQSVLTAQTWYHGKNYSLVRESFKEMINSFLTGEKTITEAINYCVRKVNLTY